MDNSALYSHSLKRLLKLKKITYRELAEQVGMTESGVKKMLNGQDLSMKRLNQLLGLLGISLAQFAQYCEQKSIRLVTLEKKQEDFLLGHKQALKVYWRFAIEKKSVQQIINLEKLPENQVYSTLEKLAQLNLIKKNKKSYQRLYEDKFRFDESSALIQNLNKNWSELTLSRALKNPPQSLQRLVTTQLNSKSYDRFFKKIEDLVQELALQSFQDEINSPAKDLRNISALLCLIDSGVLDSSF